MIEGPPTLVSTDDSAGPWITYTAVGLIAGAYQWTVLASTQCIEIQQPATGSSVQVRAKKGLFSQNPGDQVLTCVHTSIFGHVTVLGLPITAARPKSITIVKDTGTKLLAGRLTRKVVYQIKNQFDAPLRENYSYTDHAGQVVSVHVVDLLASERLQVISKFPSNAKDPVPSINQAVTTNGQFPDTHSLPAHNEMQLRQWIYVHIVQWTDPSSNLGNLVRKNQILENVDQDQEIIIQEGF